MAWEGVVESIKCHVCARNDLFGFLFADAVAGCVSVCKLEKLLGK